MNRVILVGNITKDLIFKARERVSFVKFIVAVDRNKERSDFFKCVAFDRVATYLNNYATKGTKVVIEGRLSSDKYVDKNQETQYVVEVVVEKVVIVNRKEENGINQDIVDELKSTYKAVEALDDDLPF